MLQGKYPGFGGRVHYAWIVAASTFLVLLVTAAARAAPGVFMVPLEEEFGWTSAAIFGAIAVNIALLGLINRPVRRVMDGPLGLVLLC
jgi:hypothetical protein